MKSKQKDLDNLSMQQKYMSDSLAVLKDSVNDIDTSSNLINFKLDRMIMQQQPQGKSDDEDSDPLSQQPVPTSFRRRKSSLIHMDPVDET